jgi:hypothetical protein
MRKLLIASAWLVMWAPRAQAQGVPVIDAASVLQEAKTTLQEAKNYLLQAQQYATQVQQYATEVQQYMAFVHDPSLGSAVGLMNQAGLSNDLPINPMAVQSLTSGYNSLSSLSGILGRLSQLNGLVNSSFTNNHVYTCADQSYACQQLNANGNGLAGTQGGALVVYQDLRNHLPIIQALRDRLATATTPKDVQDAQAQLQAETLWTNNLQAELASLSINAGAQREWRAQRDNEALDRGIDDWLVQANASGRGLLQ